MKRMTIALGLLLLASPAFAQGTNAASDAQTSNLTNQIEIFQTIEAARSNCIQGRRIICGRIVKMLPAGLVVESGYTNLMRHPLESSWLIPKTVEAARDPTLVEKAEPDSICVGLVYLSELPKARRTKPQLYDYVVIEGFPAGQFTYNSVGTVQHTVRHFSANLAAAVKARLKP
jgi:hypothetical protein